MRAGSFFLRRLLLPYVLHAARNARRKTVTAPCARRSHCTRPPRWTPGLQVHTCALSPLFSVIIGGRARRDGGLDSRPVIKRLFRGFPLTGSRFPSVCPPRRQGKRRKATRAGAARRSVRKYGNFARSADPPDTLSRAEIFFPTRPSRGKRRGSEKTRNERIDTCSPLRRASVRRASPFEHSL